MTGTRREKLEMDDLPLWHKYDWRGCFSNTSRYGTDESRWEWVLKMSEIFNSSSSSCFFLVLPSGAGAIFTVTLVALTRWSGITIITNYRWETQMVVPKAWDRIDINKHSCVCVCACVFPLKRPVLQWRMKKSSPSSVPYRFSCSDA